MTDAEARKATQQRERDALTMKVIERHKSRYPVIMAYLARAEADETYPERVKSVEACQQCGSIENLEAHHIAFWSKFPEFRVTIENGVTLCDKCHLDVHHPNRTRASKG